MANTNNQSFHLLCFALVLVIGHWASEAMSRPLDHESVSMRERHERWMAKYGRVYKDEAEKEKRFNIFKENVKRIEEFNRNAEGKHLYTLGFNALTDLTREEFRATYIGHKMNQSSSAWSRLSSSNKTKFSFVKLDDVPSSVNWQQMGAVTSVKDQGSCGCCWAFSTVAAIEGLNMIKNGQLISLSEQQLVDCFNGCNGKDIDLTFQYINEQTSGLATYDQYPYISQQGGIGQCQESTNPSVVAINGYIEVPPNDENALMQAVSQQPVAVTINADGFQSYSSTSGIFDGPCGSELNHAVTIVGYDTDPSGVEYWLIKNSWGEDWGENGFMRILRGQNVCSISSRASYPTM